MFDYSIIKKRIGLKITQMGNKINIKISKQTVLKKYSFFKNVWKLSRVLFGPKKHENKINTTEKKQKIVSCSSWVYLILSFSPFKDKSWP